MRRALAIALLLSGCHKSPPATTALAWDLITAQVRSDGSVSVDTARAAFSLVFAQLPGVPEPTGKGSVILDATPVVRWIEQHDAELTPQQRDAVHKALDEPTEPKADAATQARYVQLVDDASTTISTRLRIPKLPKDKIAVVVYAENVTVIHHGEAVIPLGWTDSFDANMEKHGAWASCAIAFNALVEMNGPRAIAETVPHEVFHCYQATLSPNLDAFHEVPDWINEGSAEWVNADVSGHADWPTALDGTPGRSWQKCLAEPYHPLYGRLNDAICFYAQMSAAGRSPWDFFDGIYTAYSLTKNDGAFLAGANDEAFMSGWAKSVLRAPEYGAEWDATGPGITHDKVSPQAIALDVGSVANDMIAPVSSNAYLLDAKAEVILMRTPPWSALHSTATAGFHTDQPAGDWCTNAGSCDCPMGSARAGDHVPALPADHYFLAVGGGRKGAQWLVEGETLDDYCMSDRVEKCVQGSWVLQTAGPLSGQDICTFNEPIGTVVTFAKDGTSGEDFSATSPVTCTATTTGDVATITLGGRDSAHVVADHGQMLVTNVDSSAVVVNTTLDGMDLGIGLSSLFQAKLVGGTAMSYTCQGMTMTLTNPAGTTFTLQRL